MAPHRTFRFRSLDELEDYAAKLGLDIPFTADVRPLAEPWASGSWRAPNRIAVHPMEGQDALPNGAPGPLTFRRYRRFAAGGAGLLWFEACSVVSEGRANPRQLWLHDENVAEFRTLLTDAHSAAGKDRPLCILQLTHSGRYSRPSGPPEPHIVSDNPHLFKPGARMLTDEDLLALEDRYVHAAGLAAAAGFDGVDIKACHGYLVNELLAAVTRPGRYGGSYENRTRFLMNVVRRIRTDVPDLPVAVRLNVFDGLPHPYGWGVSPEGDGRLPDLTEPIRLARELAEAGVRLLNISAGNPYYNPHVGRPFDQPVEGLYTPDEHPLEGVARLIHLTRQIQQSVPNIACVGTGYSWLRQYLGFAASGVVSRGWASFAGAGREAFANPGFARQILTEGSITASEACIACSSCTELMRDGSVAGCVPRDKEIYSPAFVEGRRRRPGARRIPHPVSNHI